MGSKAISPHIVQGRLFIAHSSVSAIVPCPPYPFIIIRRRSNQVLSVSKSATCLLITYASLQSLKGVLLIVTGYICQTSEYNWKVLLRWEYYIYWGLACFMALLRTMNYCDLPRHKIAWYEVLSLWRYYDSSKQWYCLEPDLYFIFC